MKKLLALIMGISLLIPLSGSVKAAPFPVSLGGSGASTLSGWLYGNGTSPFTASSSPHFTSFSFTRATGTAATTTNFFSTTASSTNLFGAFISGFGLSDCDADGQTVSWDASTLQFGCGDDDGAGSSASSTLLSDNNTWSGNNIFSLPTKVGANYIATTTTVCSYGCDYTSIDTAVDTVSASTTILIKNGVYALGAGTITVAGGKTLEIVGESMDGVQITYSGGGSAFTIGDSSNDTRRFRLENVTIIGTSNGTRGLSLVRVKNSTFRNIRSYGFSSDANPGQAFRLDGTGSYTGDNYFYNLHCDTSEYCLNLSGTAVNSNHFYGFNLRPDSTGNAISLTTSNGNSFHGGLVGNATQGIEFNSSADENLVIGTYCEDNTTCIVFDSGASDNRVDVIDVETNDVLVTDAGSQNNFSSTGDNARTFFNSGPFLIGKSASTSLLSIFEVAGGALFDQATSTNFYSNSIFGNFFNMQSLTSTSSVAHALRVGTTTPNQATAMFNVIDTSGTLGADYGMILTQSNDSSGGNYDIRMDSPQPDIEFIETDQVGPAGEFEIGVNSDVLYMAGRNPADTGFQQVAQFYRPTDAASTRVFALEGDNTVPADNDEIYQSFRLSDDGGNQIEFGRITVSANDVNVATSLDGSLQFSTVVAGTLAKRIRLDSNIFYPFSNDLVSLGAAGVAWSDLFLATGGVIGWGNGNASLTHSAGNLTLSSGDIFNASDAIFTRSTSTYATSTELFTTTASTTNFFGADLAECSDAGDTLGWNAGKFTCGTDATGSGGAGLATSTAIADTYVIYGTSADDVGAEAAFTYDDATNLLTVGSLSLGNGTSTNFFSTTASSTNLFGQFINGFSLSTCQAGSFLTWASGSFGCDTDDNTTYTAGDGLTLTGTDIDFDGGATPSGDLGGTWASPSVTDDSHAHTGATLSGIDVSDDINLTAGDNLTLTGDDLDLDTTLTGLVKLTTQYSSTTDYASFFTASSTNWTGGGLTDCDADAQSVSYDATTQKFGCGDDDNSGGGQFTDGGNFDYNLEETYIGTSTEVANRPLFLVGTSSELFSVASTTGHSAFGTTPESTYRLSVLSNSGVIMKLKSSALGSGTSASVDIFNNDESSRLGYGVNSSTHTSAGAAFFWMYNNFPVRFGTNNTERMRIGEDGNIGIGTTTPKWALQVASSSAPQLTLSDPTSKTNNHWSFRNQNGIFSLSTSSPATFGTTSNPAFEVRDTGTGVFMFNLSTATNDNALCIDATTKEIEDSGGATCALSSRKAKHNILDIPSAISEVMGLRPVSFVYNETGENKLGFIAEEVAAINPLLADYATMDIELSNGEEIKKGEVRSLDDRGILAKVVKAVQEMYQKLTNHESRIEKLERENLELKARLDALERK